MRSQKTHLYVHLMPDLEPEEMRKPGRSSVFDSFFIDYTACAERYIHTETLFYYASQHLKLNFTHKADVDFTESAVPHNI